MQFWKAALKTERDGADQKFREDAREYCFASGIVGLGWSPGDFLNPTDVPRHYTDAINANAVHFRKIWKQSLDSCLRNHNRFANVAGIGDYVWSRSLRSGYWIGRIIGDWHYDREPLRELYDLNQWRSCNWYNVGDAANVPGAVRNHFSSRGTSFSRMNKGAPVMQWLSAELYAERSGEPNAAEPPEHWGVLENIAHDDLEDTVGLYLQMEFGWMIVPGTAKRSTPATEFTLRHRDGRTGWLQVKASDAKVGIVAGLPDDVDVFFIFEAEPAFQPDLQPDAVRQKVSVIQADELLAWCDRAEAILPLPVRTLLEAARRHGH